MLVIFFVQKCPLKTPIIYGKKRKEAQSVKSNLENTPACLKKQQLCALGFKNFLLLPDLYLFNLEQINSRYFEMRQYFPFSA